MNTNNSSTSLRPSLSLNLQSLKQPIASTSSVILPTLNSNMIPVPVKRRKNPPPSLILQPASPQISSSNQSSFSNSNKSLPSPGMINSNGLSSKRQINKKQLSLVLKDTSIPAILVTPIASNFNSNTLEVNQVDDQDSKSILSRSLPSSPISLSTFIGVEGVEPEDRTIGRLMMKRQQDEMREQMKGGIKRRTSIPRLNLSTTNNSTTTSNFNSQNLGSTNGGSAIRLINRNSTERIDSHSNGNNEVEESFPYENGPKEILKGIWLGSEQNARDPKVLRDWGITHVLNVAKEVVCPWSNDAVETEEEEDIESKLELSKNQQDLISSTSNSPSTTTKSKLLPLRHKRNNTQTTINTNSSSTPLSSEPLFVRSTTSTPNLKTAFKSSYIPPVPSLPPIPSSSTSSPISPLPPTLPPKSNSSNLSIPTSTSTTTMNSSLSNQPQPIKFLPDPITGRPALNWLWLKWSHDESNLVEALKLEKAFEFIDSARSNSSTNDNEKENRILIHCQCGVSRSATVVIAFCMREAARALEGSDSEIDYSSGGSNEEEIEELKKITGMHEAYSFVKEKSEWIGPNLSLVFQLVAYERVLRGAPLQPEEDEEDLITSTEFEKNEREEERERELNNSNSTSSNSNNNSPQTPTISENDSDRSHESNSTNNSSVGSSSSSADEGIGGSSSRKLKILTSFNSVIEDKEDSVRKDIEISLDDLMLEDQSPSCTNSNISRPTLSNAIQSEPFTSTTSTSILPIPPIPRRVKTSPAAPILVIPTPPKPNSNSNSNNSRHSRGKSSGNFSFSFSKGSNPSAIPLFLQEQTGSSSSGGGGLSIKIPSSSSENNLNSTSGGNGSTGTSPSKLFGNATKDERRASHRRVFSLEGFNLFTKS